MRTGSLSVVLAAVLAGLGLQAQALDISKTSPVAEVTDGQVAIAGRAVRLPPGTWTYLSYAKGRYTTDGVNATERHTGYVALTQDKRFRAGIVLEMGEMPLRSNQWNDEPCKTDGNLHMARLNSTPLHPECVRINRWPTLHRAATAGFYKPVSDWLVQQGHNQSVQVYDITFNHYTATGQGVVRAFVPVSVFPNDQAAIDWGLSLPAHFRPLFQGRASEATLPPLP